MVESCNAGAWLRRLAAAVRTGRRCTGALFQLAARCGSYIGQECFKRLRPFRTHHIHVTLHTLPYGNLHFIVVPLPQRLECVTEEAPRTNGNLVPDLHVIPRSLVEHPIGILRSRKGQRTIIKRANPLPPVWASFGKQEYRNPEELLGARQVEEDGSAMANNRYVIATPSQQQKQTAAGSSWNKGRSLAGTAGMRGTWCVWVRRRDGAARPLVL